jgi:hypothetical protein
LTQERAKRTHETPSLRWDTAHSDGENVVIHFEVNDPMLHILVVDRDVLEDALNVSGGDAVRHALNARETIEAAVTKAWSSERLDEMFEAAGPRRNVQLRLHREDFS